MTDREQILKLRATGMTWRQVAEAIGLSYSTAYRLAHPEYEERQRAKSREWKARNKEHRRRYDARWHTGVCVECGGPCHKATTSARVVCRSCRHDRHVAGVKELERLWADGLSIADIAERLGCARGSITKRIHDARVAGADLPYRYRVRGGKRVGGKA